jgi:hypothetical protein
MDSKHAASSFSNKYALDVLIHAALNTDIAAA